MEMHANDPAGLCQAAMTSWSREAQQYCPLGTGSESGYLGPNLTLASIFLGMSCKMGIIQWFWAMISKMC